MAYLSGEKCYSLRCRSGLVQEALGRDGPLPACNQHSDSCCRCGKLIAMQCCVKCKICEQPVCTLTCAALDKSGIINMAKPEYVCKEHGTGHLCAFKLCEKPKKMPCPDCHAWFCLQHLELKWRLDGSRWDISCVICAHGAYEFARLEKTAPELAKGYDFFLKRRSQIPENVAQWLSCIDLVMWDGSIIEHCICPDFARKPVPAPQFVERGALEITELMQNQLKVV